MIGARTHHVAVGDGGEVAEEVLAALVGGDEAEPAGFQRPATPVLRSPRGGGDDPYPPRAGERDRLRDLPRGDRLRLRSRRSAGERERLRRAGASSCRSSPSPLGASLSRGLSWGLAMVVQPWVCRGSAWGIEHTWRPRSGGGAGGPSLFSLFCFNRPTWFFSPVTDCPNPRTRRSTVRPAIGTHRRNSNCLPNLGAHRWASRAARFGGRTPRCGSAASPRAR